MLTRVRPLLGFQNQGEAIESTPWGEILQKLVLASTNNQNTQGPIMNGTEYPMWVLIMKSFWKNLDYWDVVFTKYEEPKAAELATMINAQINASVESKIKDYKSL